MYSTFVHPYMRDVVAYHFPTLSLQDMAKDPKKKLPNNINELLDGARQALERLSRDALKILKDGAKLTDGGKALRGHYNACQQDLASINHVKLFKELPNDKPLTKQNFDLCVFEVAKHVEALNLEVESSKAKLRAKSN